ncbi:DUF6333 family protein [Streptomyces olivaceiscleroticus]|uniref:DUF4253 domain-containing protein n=1 Tax=Streptomyces olivaceiscleroticus TaxID=68245 RepID=A0ABN1ABD1_9ACTN
MTYDSFWDFPPDEPIARHGEFSLTLIRPPFPGPGVQPPAHDPEEARRFVGDFGTIEGVVEELAPVPATDAVPLGTRADLDLVRVGCWGGVTEIKDPALAPHSGGTFPTLEQAELLERRFPDAAVVASATLDHAMTYGAWSIHHPNGARLFAAGWHGEDGWDVDGDARAVLAAFGALGFASDADLDLDADPADFDWNGLARACLKGVTSIDRRSRTMSVFRVHRSEEVVGDMEENWLET